MRHLPRAAPDRASCRRQRAPIAAAIGSALIVSAAVMVALSSWVACTPSDDFKCGTPLPSDPNTIRQCDVPHQICICETNACAEPAPVKECDAGFRYVDAPFAPKERRGKCVDGPIGTWILKAGAGNVACLTEEDAGADGGDSGDDGGEAGTGGSGGSGSSTTSSSSTSGTGGSGGTSSTSSSSSTTGTGGAGGVKGS